MRRGLTCIVSINSAMYFTILSTGMKIIDNVYEVSLVHALSLHGWHPFCHDKKVLAEGILPGTMKLSMSHTGLYTLRLKCSFQLFDQFYPNSERNTPMFGHLRTY